jgi:hypothetical protein
VSLTSSMSSSGVGDRSDDEISTGVACSSVVMVTCSLATSACSIPFLRNLQIHLCVRIKYSYRCLYVNISSILRHR